jgi:hypothetical protein
MGGLSASDPRSKILEEVEKAKIADDIFEEFEVEELELTAAIAAFGILSKIDPMQAMKLGMAAAGGADNVKGIAGGAAKSCGMGAAKACCTVF